MQVGDSCNMSVISPCLPFCVPQTKQTKHKCKSLRFPSPAFTTQRQCFISAVEVMETRREACHVRQWGRSGTAACSGSSIQIHWGAPTAAADLMDFPVGMQTPSFQPVPVSCGQNSFHLSLTRRTCEMMQPWSEKRLRHVAWLQLASLSSGCLVSLGRSSPQQTYSEAVSFQCQYPAII